jgi:hypothetical protein
MCDDCCRVANAGIASLQRCRAKASLPIPGVRSTVALVARNVSKP